jgi:hypothetical protein
MVLIYPLYLPSARCRTRFIEFDCVVAHEAHIASLGGFPSVVPFFV